MKNKGTLNVEDNLTKEKNIKKTSKKKNSLNDVSILKNKDSLSLKSNVKKKKDSKAVKNYKKTKKSKQRKKRIVNGKFNLDILDLLIVVVITAIISCVLTGFILNAQYRKNVDLINSEVISDENVKNFLNTYSEIIDNYYEEVDKDAMMKAALEGMLEFLKDNYSIYLNEEQTDSLSEMLDGSYQGIGVVAVGNIVYQVYEDSPAAKAGIKPNDEIIKINGTEINLDNHQMITELIKPNISNEIIVLREGKQFTFILKTSEVSIPVVETDVIKSKDKKSVIGMISLSSFSSLAFDEFYEELKILENDKKIDSLIVDLRNNTGGYLNISADIASIFLEKGKVIYSLENKKEVKAYKDDNNEKRKYKIIVLVNSNTASAAEILAAALHDSYGATIVGNTTYGKGKVQTMKHYEDTMVKYTSAKWLRPNGECVDEVGIKPDYEIDVVYEGNIIYDKQLDKAIELLS